MDEALRKVRESAVGVELDEELAAQFPIREARVVELPGEADTIRLHVYEPLNRQPGGSVILNMHGGGFTKGYRGRDTVFARNVAFHTGCLYIDLDYHTAPEYRYPYALHEVCAAARWICENASELAVDPERLIMMGASSGGNLAAAANMVAQDTGMFACCGMILCYPPLDLVTDPGLKPNITTPEELTYARRGLLYNEWYADEDQRRDRHCSPNFAKREELRGLPPTLILTGEKDSLAHDGESFALQLAQAGVTVTLKELPDSEHGFLVRRTGGFREAEELLFAFIGAIQKKA